MIYRKQNIGLDKLRLDSRCAHDHKRLTREHGSTLRYGPDIALKFKIAQVFEKFFGEHPPAAQILDVLVVKMQILNIFDYLLKPRSYGKTAFVGILAVKNIKIGYLFVHAVIEISVAHRELIVVAQHGEVKLSVSHNSLRVHTLSVY